MKITLKRSFFIGGLIFLQILFLFIATASLKGRAAYFYSAIQMLDILAVLFVIYGRDNTSYKLAWVVLILVFPLFGTIVYLIIGTHHLPVKTRRRINNSKKFNKELRFQDPKIFDELKHVNEIYSRHAHYILNMNDKPVFKGSDAKLLTPGEAMFMTMLEELKKAQKFILLEYFIISEGKMWDAVFAVLKEKAAAGVEIKIIYDDMGSLDHISSSFLNSIRQAGIEIRKFNPFIPVLNKFMNYRDHRKITVIDGNVGITGGINIGDEYINLKRLHGHWKDTSIIIRGDAVWSLTIMFLDMWQIITGENLQYKKYKPTISCSDDGFIQPFDNNPVEHLNIGESVYLKIINNAKRYIYITTPYLILQDEMSNALCLAAMSGVDVRLITPHVADKWFIHTATRSSYQRLMECGVKIYEYLPGFIHAKTCVCDDEIGIVGSINMDYRSFFMQFECAALFYKCSVNKEIKEDFENTMKSSKMVDLSVWKNRSGLTKIAEMILYLFSPLF